MINSPVARLSVLTALVLIVAVLRTENAAGQPIGTEFTYQGQLKISGAPLNGTADFEFKLFDAPSGGTQQGSTDPVSNVNVIDGLFTVPLNFGTGVFNGDQRWLEIAARSPAGSGNFTTLSPRQPLTAAPYALYALTGPGSGGPWSVSGNDVFNTNTGNVGIGTTTPAATLHVNTSGEGVRIQGPSAGAANVAWLEFRDSAGTRTGYVGDGSSSDSSVYLTSDAGDVHLYTAVGAALSAKSNGNVGIGTSSPSAKLEVRGDIRLGPSGQYRATASEENLRIIRGEVGPAGEIRLGSGFTATIIGAGQCDITFTTPFSSTPVVTATPYKGLGGSTAEMIVMIGFISTTKVSLFTRNAALSEWGNWYIDFIAIGPR